MIINNSNTSIILIYTNKGTIEKRFITDIIISLLLLKNLQLNSDIRVLIEGITPEDFLLEAQKYNIGYTPIIKRFHNNYADEIKKINKENLIICTTGHGDDFSKYMQMPYYPEVYPEAFYTPINNNPIIKNVIFVWGQCLSGLVYKDIENPQKNFYLFGASDSLGSKSSNIFVYEALKQKNEKFSEIIKNNDYLINVFLFLFFLYLKFYIDREINNNDIVKLFNLLKSNYISIASVENTDDFGILSNLINQKIKLLNSDETINLYSTIVSKNFNLEDSHNLPWLKCYINGEIYDYSGINLEIQSKFKIDILMISSLIFDLIYRKTNSNEITITPLEVYEQIFTKSNPYLYDIITITFSMILLSSEKDIYQINETAIDKSNFTYHFPKDHKIELEKQIKILDSLYPNIF